MIIKELIKDLKQYDQNTEVELMYGNHKRETMGIFGTTKHEREVTIGWVTFDKNGEPVGHREKKKEDVVYIMSLMALEIGSED